MPYAAKQECISKVHGVFIVFNFKYSQVPIHPLPRSGLKVIPRLVSCWIFDQIYAAYERAL